MKELHIPSEELSQYIDGFGFTDFAYEEHLHTCAQCMREMRQLERTRAFVSSISLLSIRDEHFGERVFAGCIRTRNKRRYLIPASAAAVFFLILTISLVNYYDTPAPLGNGPVALKETAAADLPIRYTVATSNFKDIRSLGNYVKTGAQIVEKGKNYIIVDVAKGNLSALMNGIDASGEDIYFIRQRGLSLTGGDGMAVQSFGQNEPVRVKISLYK